MSSFVLFSYLYKKLFQQSNKRLNMTIEITTILDKGISFFEELFKGIFV